MCSSAVEAGMELCKCCQSEIDPCSLRTLRSIRLVSGSDYTNRIKLQALSFVYQIASQLSRMSSVKQCKRERRNLPIGVWLSTINALF